MVPLRQQVRRDRRHAGEPARPRARKNRLAWSLAAAVAAVSLPAFTPRAPSGSAVSVSGKTLQLDGHSTFLLGVSLFDALGPTPPRNQDLDALRTWGVNTVRVWAHWHEPIYQADGRLTTQGRSRLLQLVQRLQARGLVLELVLLRPGQLPGQPFT